MLDNCVVQSECFVLTGSILITPSMSPQSVLSVRDSRSRSVTPALSTWVASSTAVSELEISVDDHAGMTASQKPLPGPTAPKRHKHRSRSPRRHHRHRSRSHSHHRSSSKKHHKRKKKLPSAYAEIRFVSLL